MSSLISSSQAAGLPCPNCGTFIGTTLEGLLGTMGVTCPNLDCRTVLTINHAASAQSVDAMKVLKEEFDKTADQLGNLQNTKVN